MNGNESSPPSSSSASDDDGASDAASRVLRAASSAPAERQSCSALLRAAVRNPDQLTAMISNYSTSYNAVNVGIALPVLNYSVGSIHNRSSEQQHPYSSPSSSSNSDHRYYLPASPSTAERALGGANEDEQDSLVASSLMAGMIVGQLIGGVLGDVLGRRRAMMLVVMLQIGGSLGSALFVSTEDGGGGGPTALEQLAIWRFILGIGAGGVYPLAAVMSAENKETDGPREEKEKKEEEDDCPAANVDAGGLLTNDGATFGHERGESVCHQAGPGNGNGGYVPASVTENHRVDDATVASFQRIALTFSTQGLGFLSVPLLAYPMLELGFDTDVIWRVLLGCGALPGLLVLFLRLCAVNVRGCTRSGVSETAVARGDDLARRTSSMTRTESFELITPNQRNEDEFNAESTLFCDVTSSESNEEALVENSHLEDDNRYLEKQLENQEDACKDGGSTSPIRGHSRGLWESIKTEPNLGRKFAGTAGTWFLFDVVFYGNTLFEPFVLEAAFGSHSANSDGYELLQTAVRDSLVISLLALPGYFITVFIIGRRTGVCVCRSIRSSLSSTRFGSAPCFPCYQSPGSSEKAFIQIQGFLLMFMLYSIIGLFWTSLSKNQSLLLVLYSGTFLFANYGPNTTTFLLPSVTYSEDCRSTLNGMSAAAGKLGALVGASLFAPAADMWGVNIVMICCACVCLVACGLTKICLG